MSDDTRRGRRRFLGSAVTTLAATKLWLVGSAHAQWTMIGSARPTSGAPEPRDSFAPLKQIDAGLLNIGYAEDGRANGRPVILLHGWPYDIHSFAEVSPLLAKAGFRVIVPHLRGYGTTRFLSNTTVRNGQQSVVALDIIALMDALEIESAVVAGFRQVRAPDHPGRSRAQPAAGSATSVRRRRDRGSRVSMSGALQRAH